MSGFLSVDGVAENTTVIERSKFICQIKGVENEEQAKEFIASVKKRHSLATHNCYAYISDELGLIQKFSDDGEPQGTAGVPMLEALKSRKIFKAVAVVTRYFGGVKLGAGGLVRAYNGAVCECLDKAKIVSYKQAFFYNIYPDYESYSKLLRLYSKNVCCIKTDFSEKITVELAVVSEEKQTFIAKLNDVFSGKIEFTETGTGYFPFNNV